MYRVPHHLPSEPDEDDLTPSPTTGGVLFLLFGVATLAGLVSGILWIGWTLCRLHVWP